MNEALSTKDAKKLNKASMLSTSTNPKDQDRARARQTEVDYKDLVRQLKAKRKMKNESFTIDKSAHKSAQKKAKLRNLAKGNTNPNEKAAAEKKAGGPKLYGEARYSDTEMLAVGKGQGKPMSKEMRARADAALAHHDAMRKKQKKKMNEAKVDQGRSDYGKASIRNYRRSGPGYGEPAMFDPENKRGKLIDKRREEHKARRGVKKAKVPAYKVSEGKTFDAWKKAAAKALGKKKEERTAQKAMDAGARLRRKKQRQEYAAKISGSEDNVPDEIRD